MTDDLHKPAQPKRSKWTAKKEAAAILVAEDDPSDTEIAKQVGVARRTLATWKDNPEFAAHVGGHIGRLQAAMLRLPIAKKRLRLRAYNERWETAQKILQYRAERYRAQIGDADAETAAAKAARRIFGHEVPYEAVTGYLVEKESVNNAGHRTVEWAVDLGLMREMRALEQQAAQELGQWESKLQIEGLTTTIEIVGVDADLL